MAEQHNCREHHGSSSYITLDDPTGFTADAAWSIGLWAYLDDNTGRGLVEVGDADNNRGVYMYVDASSKLNGQRLPGPENIGAGATTVTASAWHRFGLTKTSSGTSTIQLILDGTQEKSTNVSTPSFSAGDHIRFGASRSAAGIARLDGRMAWAFLVQGVKLSAAALDGYLQDPRSLVDDYGPSGSVTADALKILWPCQCDFESTEQDLSGVGNHGTYAQSYLLRGGGPTPTTGYNDPCGARNWKVNVARSFGRPR